jgi:hypothetical protein
MEAPAPEEEWEKRAAPKKAKKEESAEAPAETKSKTEDA